MKKAKEDPHEEAAQWDEQGYETGDHGRGARAAGTRQDSIHWFRCPVGQRGDHEAPLGRGLTGVMMLQDSAKECIPRVRGLMRAGHRTDRRSQPPTGEMDTSLRLEASQKPKGLPLEERQASRCTISGHRAEWKVRRKELSLTFAATTAAEAGSQRRQRESVATALERTDARCRRRGA